MGSNRTTVATLIAVAAATAGIGLGQRLLIHHGLTLMTVSLLSAGSGALLWATWPRVSAPASAPAEGTVSAVDGPGRPWLLAAGLINVALAMAWSWGRPPDRNTYDITLMWLLGLMLVIAAGMTGRFRRDWRPQEPSRATVAGVAIVAVAAVARLVVLARFPSVLDSDEGYYLLTARQARLGHLANPYGTSFWSNPDLYKAWSGIVSRPFADTYGSYRILSGLVGTAGVLFAWRLGRRLVGERAALAGAALLALLPFNLWASRNGLNNITNGVTFALAGLFLVRTMENARRSDALALGLVVGFGLYGYFPAVVVPVALAVWLATVAVLDRVRPVWREVGRLSGWMLAGAFAAAAPLLGSYGAHPSTFTSRYHQVGVAGATPGWADRLALVPHGFLYPFWPQREGFAGGFFRHGPPFIGWWVAPLAWVGLAVWLGWIARSLRRPSACRFRPEGLLVLWLLIGAGVSQTVDTQSQRSVGIAFVWALAAGTGLVTALEALGTLVPAVHRWTPLLGGAVLVAIGLVHAHGYYDEAQQIRAYSDLRTAAAYDLGWRLSTMSSPPSVLLESEPFYSYHGMGNFQFLAPGLERKVIEADPLAVGPGGSHIAPDVAHGQLVVVATERDDAEHCAWLARYPQATVSQVRAPSGAVLYTLYEPDPLATLPRLVTPAGGRIVVADRSSPAGRPITCP